MSETFYRTRNNQCLLLLKSIYYVMSILLDKFRMVCGQYWPSISKVLSNSSALLFIYLFIYLFFARYHHTITLDSYYSFHHTIHLSYRRGFLFPLDYSLFSMTAVSNSSWDASLLKELHTVPLRSRIRWLCMILKIMLFSQYLRLHMTTIC